MENYWFIAAGVASLITLGMHFVLGGKYSARPLLKADMRSVPKFTNYYCWHLVTLMLLAMAASFFAAAFKPAAIELAILMTALSGASALWNIALWLWKRQSPLLMPQWLLFAPVAILGWIGIEFQSSIAIG